MAIIRPKLAIDGDFSDWVASERIDYGDVTGYSLYAAAQDGFLYLHLAAATAIGPNTTFWLNTDLNASTGYQIFGFAGGAEYNINIKSDGTAALYTGGAGQTLVLDNLQLAYSADHLSVELAIPLSNLGNPGHPIDVLYDVNDTQFGPTNYSGQPYVASTSDVTRTATHKVAIVYSDTSAARYFSPSAYSDLFMAAQNQARMAGVSYDVIDESQLSNVNNLLGYDALIFPGMANVNSTQLPSIMQALTSAVYDYHIGIIAAGDFLTNDQTGAVLANPYQAMQTLLGLTRYAGGNSGDVTVTANDVTNPIMASYTAGQVIHSYSGAGYSAYQTLGTVPEDVLVNQNVTNVGTLPGVVQTTTGGTNVHFASQALLGDNNLLSNAIQNLVLGTGPGVALHTSRQAGIVAARMDMDQSQFPADVSPAGGTGIYDKLIPILQQWKSQYDFVGSYYVNIGDNPNSEDASATDWTKSLAYYKQIIAMGGEIGTHSYTHLINPPTTTFTAQTVGDTPAGSTTITLDHVPAFYGITVGMWLTGTGIGSNATIPSGDGSAVINTQVTAVSGNTITISYIPTGFGGSNQGTTGTIASGTTLTFSIPPENTNFLEPTTGTDPSGVGSPFTYEYEFNQSKLLLEQMLGSPVYGAAVPGAGETVATSQNILSYFPSGSGYTGYVTGGWTGIGAGYPGAIGYINPTQQGSIYLAPNVTFDFTEIQYQGKTIAQAQADWAAQFNELAANSAGTPIAIWPIHDYGAAAWNTTTDSPTGSPYTTDLFTNFIAMAYNADYEFVTLEELASRIAAQEKAHVDYSTSGNTINITVTPDPTAPDLGAMALDVINQGSSVIQNVTNWYAYNDKEVFLARNGGSFAVNLGTTQDDVTHIADLPMRGDLLSVSGDQRNLSFSMVGDGNVLVDLGQIGAGTPLVTGATIVSLVGDKLTLGLTGLGQHDVSISIVPGEAVTTLALSKDSGPSSSDFVTNVAAQTLTGSLSAPLSANNVVKVSLDNGATWLLASAATGATTFSLPVSLVGSNTLIARVEDPSGTFSTPFAHTYVLDTTVVAPAGLALAAASDSGSSATDGVTKVTKPTFTGKGEVGGTVSVYDGNTLLGSAAVSATGDWSFVGAATLTEGQHSISAAQVDLAGNVSSRSAPLLVTIDTLPTIPASLALASGSDSGTSTTDRITNVAKPTFTGKGEAGGQVTVYDGTTMLGTGIVSAAGTWSVADTLSTLANGVHSITATELDLAGNLSARSTALAITIDTAAPAVPTRLALAAASDSGVSNKDAITNVKAPTITGSAEAGSLVQLYDGTSLVGKGTAASNGTFSIATSALSDGVHSLTAAATDTAGNLSTKSGALKVTIDTAAPAAPAFTSLSSGLMTTTIAGKAEAGATISVLNASGTTLGTTAVNSSGSWSWSFLSGLSGSVRSMTAVATDAAGNKGVSNGTVQLGTIMADTLTSSAGNDIYYGGMGADTFAFSSLFGRDIISDFQAAGMLHDQISFKGNSVLNSFTAVMNRTANVSGGVMITQDANNSLFLANVSKSALTAADFKFA